MPLHLHPTLPSAPPRLSTRWLLETVKVKLIPVVERLQREKDEYLQGAIGALRSEMARLVPAICSQVGSSIFLGGGCTH